jgi:hypothetical protein
MLRKHSIIIIIYPRFQWNTPSEEVNPSPRMLRPTKQTTEAIGFMNLHLESPPKGDP